MDVEVVDVVVVDVVVEDVVFVDVVFVDVVVVDVVVVDVVVVEVVVNVRLLQPQCSGQGFEQSQSCFSEGTVVTKVVLDVVSVVNSSPE